MFLSGIKLTAKMAGQILTSLQNRYSGSTEENLLYLFSYYNTWKSKHNILFLKDFQKEIHRGQ